MSLSGKFTVMPSAPAWTTCRITSFGVDAPRAHDEPFSMQTTDQLGRHRTRPRADLPQPEGPCLRDRGVTHLSQQPAGGQLRGTAPYLLQARLLERRDGHLVDRAVLPHQI